MKQIIALPSFARSARKLNPPDKSQLAESLEQFNNFVISGDLPIGLGFKKIGQDKYEFRAGLKLRVVVKLEEIISSFKQKIDPLRSLIDRNFIKGIRIECILGAFFKNNLPLFYNILKAMYFWRKVRAKNKTLLVTRCK